MKIVSIRHLLCAIGAALSVVAGASAQPAPAPNPALPPTFALLSLVGDQFSVVFRRPETGSRLDTNDRRDYPIAEPLLDDVALSAAEEAIKRAKPVAPVLRFSIRDARLFALQDKLLADSPESHDLRDALAKLLRENGATRLVLVTKRRDEAQFKLLERTTGTGKIAGIGFYVDSYMRLRTTETGESAAGFLGPFAYLSVSLVDVASMTTVRSVPARESQMNMPLNNTGAVRAWDALTPQGKLEALEGVVHRAVLNATAAVIAD